MPRKTKKSEKETKFIKKPVAKAKAKDVKPKRGKKKAEKDVKEKKKTLLKKVKKLPAKRGLYTWLDENGHPIYIGKAKNVRRRAKQHLIKGESTKDVDKITKEACQPAFKYVQQPGYLDKLEKIAVRAYQPTYNKNDFL
jgi:excinuclease ABC subunit C